MPAAAAVLDDLVRNYPDLAPCRASVAAALDALTAAVRGGGKILLCGNGGSAADCSHIAGELLKSLCLRRALGDDEKRLFAGEDAWLAEKLEGGIPAISLPDQGAIQSAFANDVDADLVFAQLVWALGRPGDVLWAISTSGNSRNAVHALKTARRRGMTTVGLLGRDGGAMKPLCDVAIVAPGADTQRIQERHLPIYHALCMGLERAIFGDEG